MKKEWLYKRVFGVNEWKMADYPVKISGIQLSRLLYGNAMGCSRCFPHGYETINSTIVNRQRSWKKFRKTQWKRCVKPRNE
jgi:hypothetical protein